MATTGYEAGIETSEAELSYAPEAIWGQLPAVAFRALRMTGESLTKAKTRNRPREINRARQASAPVTTQIGASGTINVAYSAGTYDDLFQSMLGSAWAADVISNGDVFQSYYLQKRLASNIYFRYPGAYVTGGNITLSTGQFATGSFNIIAKSQELATADASTGAIIPAPAGKVIDTVAGFTGLTIDGAPVPAVVESISLDLNNEGAQANFGLGSPDAQGLIPGIFTASGRFRTFFRDSVLYQRYEDELEGELAFTMEDSAGKSYAFRLPGTTLMNPNVVAGGPGQAIMAEYTLEASPGGVTNKTVIITRTT